MDTIFLVLSLFLPRTILIVYYFIHQVPMNNMPFIGDALLTVFLPRLPARHWQARYWPAPGGEVIPALTGSFAQLEGFEIAGADKKFYPAKARIAGRTRNVEVWSDQVAQPVAVRYAFRNYVGNITLRNTLGIAAFPFRTDTWDDVK